MNARNNPGGAPPPGFAENLRAALGFGDLPEPGTPEPWATLLERVANSPPHQRNDVLLREAAALGIEEAVFPSPPLMPPTLADVAHLVGSEKWVWPGWIADGVLTCLAAREGVGKTRFGLELAARLWRGQDWPDKTKNEHPEQSRTLWVPFDNHLSQLTGAAEEFGLPLHAVALGTELDNPTEPLSIDSVGGLALLNTYLTTLKPKLAFIDTISNGTLRKTNQADEAAAVFVPLMRIARETGVAIVIISHLSAQGEPLGRRIKGACRTVITLDECDPENEPGRLRVQVTKSGWKKPAPLGATANDLGFTFDDSPPTKPTGAGHPLPRSGRPPVKLTACTKWLRNQLAIGPQRLSQLRTDAEKAGFASQTLYDARDRLVEEFETDGRMYWRLKREESDDADDRPAF